MNDPMTAGEANVFEEQRIINRRRMKMKKEKRELEPIQITPPLIIEYAWLDKPRPPFEKKEGAEAKFTLTVSGNSDDEDVKALMQLIDGEKRPRGVPYAVDKESGDIHFKFSSKYPAEIFDSHGNKADGIFPGAGSVVRVAFRRNEYPGFGGGVNLYLQGVQIIELVPWSPRGNVEFPAFDGGTFVADPDQDQNTAKDEAASGETLPF